MKKLPVMGLVVLLLSAMPVAARGGTVFSFDQSAYTVAPGGQVSIPVYLSVDGTEFNELEAGNGLFSAGVRFLRTAGVAGVFNTSDVTANTSAFNDLVLNPTITLINSGDARLQENQDIFSASTGVFGTVSGNTARIFLGSFNVTAPNTPGTSSTFSATHYPTSAIVTFGSGPGFTQNIFTLDPTTDAAVTIRTTDQVITTAVPLPSAAMMGGAFLGLLAAGKRISRRFAKR